MKKVLTIFAVLFATMLVACSEEDSPDVQKVIDADHINTLSRDGSVYTYEKVFAETYYAADSNSELVKEEGMILGGSSRLESTMSFQDGKLWKPVTLFSSSTGPFPVGDVWKAYCKVNGGYKDLYVTLDFEYDEPANKLIIEGKKIDILEFNEKKLVLQYDYSDYKGDGRNREIGFYEKVKPVRFDGKNALQFESEYECYLYIAKKGREQFGRYIDLNKVLYQDIAILDDPIVDMDMVDAWIEKYKELVLDKGLEW